MLFERDQAAVSTAALTVYRAFELGIATNYGGAGGSVVELPPMVLSRDQTDVAVAALDGFEAGRVALSNTQPYHGWCPEIRPRRPACPSN